MPALVQISVADGDLRAYLTDCLNRMPDVHVTGRQPQLIVTDSRQLMIDDVPRLYLVDEPPMGAVDFVLMPFDARTLAHAVRRALQRYGR